MSRRYQHQVRDKWKDELPITLKDKVILVIMLFSLLPVYYYHPNLLEMLLHFSIAAIAGLWVVMTYRIQRTANEKGNISIDVIDEYIQDIDKILISGEIRFANEGSTIIQLSSIGISLLDSSHPNRVVGDSDGHLYCDHSFSLNWPEIQERKISFEDRVIMIEGNENKVFKFDFLVESNITRVNICASVTQKEIEDSNDIVWHTESIHRIFKRD